LLFSFLAISIFSCSMKKPFAIKYDSVTPGDGLFFNGNSIFNNRVFVLNNVAWSFSLSNSVNHVGGLIKNIYSPKVNITAPYVTVNNTKIQIATNTFIHYYVSTNLFNHTFSYM
jgi:hypothetical protein